MGDSYMTIRAFARARGWDDVAVASTIAYWLDLSTCSQWYACIVEGDALEIRMCWVRGADQRFCLTADVTFEEAPQLLRAHIKECERQYDRGYMQRLA